MLYSRNNFAVSLFFLLRIVSRKGIIYENACHLKFLGAIAPSAAIFVFTSVEKRKSDFANRGSS